VLCHARYRGIHALREIHQGTRGKIRPVKLVKLRKDISNTGLLQLFG
jgi:hypothetical protein